MSKVMFKRDPFPCMLDDETRSLGLKSGWLAWLYGRDFNKVILTTPTIDASVVVHLPPGDVVGILRDRTSYDRTLGKCGLRSEQRCGLCTCRADIRAF